MWATAPAPSAVLQVARAFISDAAASSDAVVQALLARATAYVDTVSALLEDRAGWAKPGPAGPPTSDLHLLLDSPRQLAGIARSRERGPLDTGASPSRAAGVMPLRHMRDRLPVRSTFFVVLPS